MAKQVQNIGHAAWLIAVPLAVGIKKGLGKCFTFSHFPASHRYNFTHFCYPSLQKAAGHKPPWYDIIRALLK